MHHITYLIKAGIKWVLTIMGWPSPLVIIISGLMLKLTKDLFIHPNIKWQRQWLSAFMIRITSIMSASWSASPSPGKMGFPVRSSATMHLKHFVELCCIIVFGSGTQLWLSAVFNTLLCYLFSHYDVPIFSWLQYSAFPMLCGSLQPYLIFVTGATGIPM